MSNCNNSGKMVSLKRRTTPTVPVRIKNFPHADIASVTFLFKQFESEKAPAILEKEWPGEDVSYDSVKDRFLLEFSEEETALFSEDRFFFMDTKITTTLGKIPKTPIKPIMMKKTLFGGGDDDDN